MVSGHMVSSKMKSASIAIVIFLGGCVFTVFGKIVTTNNGQINGNTQLIDGVYLDTYLGVPFAAPPLGDLRFRAPQDVQNWTGVRQTKTQPDCCMQSDDTNFNRFHGVQMWNCNTKISEDCLYLNLWVPRSVDGSKLTTMLWIYGGSFVYGSNTLDVYDGTYLSVKENVIVASMQYRMGVHGFLYTGGDDAPGNVGLRDQQMAMKWIYENIEHFGGDQSKITLFGESAGSVSVSYHLIIPSSVSYFTNAIMQSGTFLSEWAINTPQSLLLKTKSFAKIMNCDKDNMNNTIDCLRLADAIDLENNQWSLDLGRTEIGTLGVVMDGDFIPNYPTYLLDSGKVKDGDILLGTTKDEGEFFLVYQHQDIILPSNLWTPVPLNRSEYLEIASRISGLDKGLGLDMLLYVYESSNLPSTWGTYRDVLDDMFGDYIFKCGARKLADWTSKHNSDRKTFVYRFDYINSNNPWPSYMGSLHAYEIESVFGIPFNPKYNYTEADRNVSSDVMSYFAAFAKTGNANSAGSGLTTWPEYSSDNEEVLVISSSHTIKKGFRTKECPFVNDIAPRLSQFNSGQTNGDVNGSESHSIPGFIQIAAILFSLLLIALS